MKARLRLNTEECENKSKALNESLKKWQISYYPEYGTRKCETLKYKKRTYQKKNAKLEINIVFAYIV